MIANDFDLRARMPWSQRFAARVVLLFAWIADLF